MFIKRCIVPIVLITLLGIGVCLSASATGSGAYSISAAAESAIVGGSNCRDFLDGFAVGMGIGVLFGCVWCAAGAIGAKAIGLFC